MDFKKLEYSPFTYEIKVFNTHNKTVIDWFRVRERHMASILRGLCGASDEQIKEFLLQVENDNSAAFRGRKEPFYILQAINKQ